MKKLIGIVASVGLAGAFLVPAASASAAEGTSIGVTAVRVNYDVTKALLQANVFVNGEDPGGSTILSPGKVALEFPIDSNKAGKLGHEGSLFLSHTGAMGWRTVVVTNLTIDTAKGTLKGRVYATDTDLGTATIFTLKKQKSGAYTVKLASGAAGILNSSLGTHVFVEGMRIGSASVTLTPQ